MRAQLLGQLVAAQFEIEAALNEVAGNAAALGNSMAQLQLLSALQRQIGAASPAALAGLRSEITAVASTAQTVAQQSRAAIASGHAGRELAEASGSARHQVSSLVRDLHRFDPFLQFGSDEDEAAYRRREGERLAGIQQELARGTPQGDLNASGLMVGQMADAYAHGAGDSPEFRARWDALVESTAQLRAVAVANGLSTEAFDRNLREDLRTILRAKGYSDSQIDAHFAAHPNPLDAVQGFVDAQDIAGINARVMEIAQDVPAPPGSSLIAAPPPANPGTMADALATLSAAGVIPAVLDGGTNPNHGLAVQVAAAATVSRMV